MRLLSLLCDDDDDDDDDCEEEEVFISSWLQVASMSANISLAFSSFDTRCSGT